MNLQESKIAMNERQFFRGLKKRGMKSARPAMDTTSASKYFALEMAANVLSWMSNLLHVMDRVYTSF